jgi:hypothetical protein
MEVVSVSTNEVNTFSVSELEYIRESIESMNKFHQIEALRILNKHKEVTLNENKYGIHINLSELQNEVLNELNEFIQYVNTQEKNLEEAEKQKESYKSTYFSTSETKENS